MEKEKEKEKEKERIDLRIFAGARVEFIITDISLVGMDPIRTHLAPTNILLNESDESPHHFVVETAWTDVVLVVLVAVTSSLLSKHDLFDVCLPPTLSVMSSRIVAVESLHHKMLVTMKR
ncbi:hypothetical protein IGI04_007670 [Brassica rapa subsp. trilocularis]|uniref:Uncharacterized protein n=1 Tax=Brassica rapa subsp. trilocularis TaxID=1813537 RepID=A0ABQ7NMF9_BRACM|nr:hypothetical protein IGI04_007670 [Brassica rapa subsp. trilocularis]